MSYVSLLADLGVAPDPVVDSASDSHGAGSSKLGRLRAAPIDQSVSTQGPGRGYRLIFGTGVHELLEKSLDVRRQVHSYEPIENSAAISVDRSQRAQRLDRHRGKLAGAVHVRETATQREQGLVA